MQMLSVNASTAISPPSRQGETALSPTGPKAEPAAVTPVQTQEAVKATKPEDLAAQVEEAVKKINSTIKLINQDVGLEFGTDEDTKIRLVKLIDTQSKEVLRQFPSEEVIQIAKVLDKLQGLLVRDKA